MTIDEHMAQLKKLKSFHNGSYGASINFALEIMRKYEKIEEILKDDYEKDCGDKADFFRIGDIRMTINGESR